jgi:polyisoprenoid-binding protein YceI
MIKITLGLLTVLSLSVHAGKIDQKKSVFKWLGTKVTGKHFGTIMAQSGNVELDGNKIKSGKIVINLKSISATDLKGEWKQKLEGHLKADDFFNVKKYPTAMIEVKKVYSKTIMADLTIKGKTSKIEFPYTMKGKTISGAMTFDRTKFGMKYKSGNFFKDLGDKLINNDVKIDYSIVLM